MDTDNIEDIVHAHIVALSKTFVDVLNNDDADKAEDLGKAFEQFETSLIDEAEKARRRRRRKITTDEEDNSVPPEPPGAMARISETTKGNFMREEQFRKTVKSIVEAGEVSDFSQREFVELGKKIFGDKEFRRMMCEDADVYNAIAILHKCDTAKWTKKWHGARPQLEIDVKGEIAKMRRDGAPKTWPHVEQKPNISESIEGVPADLERMIQRELKSAPWLSIAAATARVKEAVRAAERVAARAKEKTFVRF
jgi:hypothetical protein